jgi:two-component system response regulator FixJ
MNHEPTVFVVDDDEAIRDSLSMLLESVGLPHQLYSTAMSFLENPDNQQAGCLVLDIRMPGMSGLELQAELLRRKVTLPIIFITGHGDIAMAVKAMRLGALDFITKPYHEQELLDRIHEALTCDASKRKRLYDHDQLSVRIESLSKRERQVFERVAVGQANKVIAYDLNVSERTVEVHRSEVMKKMGARTLAMLVRMHLEAERPLFEPVVSSALLAE